ncbi:MAG: hypothetical protein K0S93_634 [Nitrososphaeraceae archaeon]|jgi:hypothetical protein|nr:hypothetical protein [Nitrososphaeraceae archaeon]
MSLNQQNIISHLKKKTAYSAAIFVDEGDKKNFLLGYANNILNYYLDFKILSLIYSLD